METVAVEHIVMVVENGDEGCEEGGGNWEEDLRRQCTVEQVTSHILATLGGRGHGYG